jgi:hypothetical protein
MPLKADSKMTNAEVITKTPTIDIRVIHVITFFFLEERKYRSAM